MSDKESDSESMPRRNAVSVSVVVGVLGGLVFVFVFPRGALSTLMHEVFHLPGPGAGTALMVGPLAIVLAVASRLLTSWRAAGAVALAAFSATMSAVQLLRPESFGEQKGKFGSVEFLLAMLLCAGALELGLRLTRRLKRAHALAVSGAAANFLLLAFHFVVIFAQTAGWVKPGAAVLLLAISLAAGALAGIILHLLRVGDR